MSSELTTVETTTAARERTPRPSGVTYLTRVLGVWAAGAALLFGAVLRLRLGDSQAQVWYWFLDAVVSRLLLMSAAVVALRVWRAGTEASTALARTFFLATVAASVAYFLIAITTLLLEPLASLPLGTPVGAGRPLVFFIGAPRTLLTLLECGVEVCLGALFVAAAAPRTSRKRAPEEADARGVVSRAPAPALAVRTYRDFDLLVERAGDHYRARVLTSPAGQAAGEFALPELEGWLAPVLTLMRSGRSSPRGPGSSEADAVKAFGERLYDSVFTESVETCLSNSIARVEEQQVGLRVRLRLADVPELSDVPWEFLWSPARSRFLALSTETVVVRYLDMPGNETPLLVQAPLRILVLIANPSGTASLDVEAEFLKLERAVAERSKAGDLVLDRVDHATYAALQHQLQRHDYHVLHFIGHGEFDAAAGDGQVLLENDDHSPRRLNGTDLGVLLHDHASLRLVVLNACEGARSGRKDVFAGVAQSLMRQGLPAAVAMQFAVSDTAAILFAREFYGALAQYYPVDAAVAEARKAIYGQPNYLEWATPVLHLRAPQSQLFGRG
ncbi:MAG TPA: CHAT domain-containing protein [Myxococcota bacterium]|nr:CHAT domain-containing protein [Myxococcota bacterium]